MATADQDEPLHDSHTLPANHQKSTLTVPLDVEIAAWLNTLDESGVELFHERAGIREFDGGLSRFDAEAAAQGDVLRWLQGHDVRSK